MPSTFRATPVIAALIASVAACVALSPAPAQAQHHHPAGSASAPSASARGVTSAAPPALRASDLARRDGEALGRDLVRRAVDRRLRGLVSAWESADGAERDSLLSPLSAARPERLRQALVDRRDWSYDAPTGRVTGNFVVGGRLAPFVAYVPEDYTPDRAWPMHVDLHGGGSAAWRACDRNWVEGMPAKEGVILLCPGVNKRAGWFMPRGEKTWMAAVEAFKARYRVDTDRLSVGGASSGGFGAWHAATKFPWLWRAAVVRCAATPKDPETLNNLGSMGAFLIHGSRDHKIAVDNSRRSYDLLSRSGRQVEYVEVEGMGHAYGRQYNDLVLSWLSRQERRVGADFSYRVVRLGQGPSRLHWLKPRWAGKARLGQQIEGTIAEAPALSIASPTASAYAANEVEVRSSAPLVGFSVLLNASMWNPEQPVVVTYNGREVYRGQPEASTRAVLDSWVDHHDPAMVATHEIDVRLSPQGEPRVRRRAARRRATLTRGSSHAQLPHRRLRQQARPGHRRLR